MGKIECDRQTFGSCASLKNENTVVCGKGGIIPNAQGLALGSKREESAIEIENGVRVASECLNVAARVIGRRRQPGAAGAEARIE